ncbi:MAG: MFS transporter [Caldibacillus debilis]|uniref:MFS transporter n=2 Tax=Caldibacillus debilis TaxID=301148 RepID=A0A3E0K7C6_9BACI|nr:MAG: MFS transporter [Caldibacillus debilis]
MIKGKRRKNMPRKFWLLILGAVVNATGSAFLWPLHTIYIHDYLGKSLSVAGMVIMLNSAAGVVGSLAGGALYDKIGAFRTIVLGIAIDLLSLAGLTIWHGWPQYPFFLLFIGLGFGIVHPAMYAFAGELWKEGGRRAYNGLYVAINLGVAVGSALGGMIASLSFDYIFVANLLLFIVFSMMVVIGFRDAGGQGKAGGVRRQGPETGNDHKYFAALLILCFGYLLCCIAYSQWTTTIATYTQELRVSLKQYSLLWTINGLLIILGQPLLNLFIRAFMRTIKKQMVAGLVIFIASFYIASISEHFYGFAAAMAVLTVGEMLVWPAIPTVADQLAPKGKEGFYQGVVNSTNTGGRMIGPLLGGWLVDKFNMQVLFNVLMFLFVIAIVTSLTYDKGLKKGAVIRAKDAASMKD